MEALRAGSRPATMKDRTLDSLALGKQQALNGHCCADTGCTFVCSLNTAHSHATDK